MRTRVVEGRKTFSLKDKSRLIVTLHPRKERIEGVTRGVIEVSEMIYGREMINRKKILF